MNISKTTKVSSFVDDLQAHGRYTFTKEEATHSVTSSPAALNMALNRLCKKQRIFSPKRGFYVIIPLEYRSTKAVPISWFIHDLMKYLQQPYYVGLLTAAELYGAAHQRPQEFQVITDRPLRLIPVGRTRIRFVTKKTIHDTPTLQKQTPTGYITVSTPESTAIDLLRYVSTCGYLNSIATVLSELSESIDKKKLLHVAKITKTELPYIQRLGYLLDLTGAHDIAEPLAASLQKENPRITPLLSYKTVQDAEISARWFLAVNERVEADL